MSTGAPNVTIEREDGSLRIFAVAPPLWPMIAIGAGVAVVLGWLAIHIYRMAMREFSRPRGLRIEIWIIAAVALAMIVAVVVIFVQKIRKQKSPRGLMIESGEVTALTPDDTRPSHRFALAEISAADMRASPTSNLVDLVVHLRNGGSVTPIRQQPPEDIIPAVDAINAVLQSDRHFGFEVVVRGVTDDD